MLPFRRSLFASCLCVVAAVATAAAQGRATTGLATVSLQYEAPGPGGRCPTADKMENSIAARLGFYPFQQGGRFAVRATIRSEGRDLVGIVELIGKDGRRVGRRELRSPSSDCEGLAEAMAVAISVALEPIATPPSAQPPGSSSPPSPLPPAPASRATAPDPPPFPKPEARETPANPIQLHASLGSMLTAGTTPGPAVGILTQVGIRRAAWSAAIEGKAELITVTRVGDREIHSSLISAWLVPCWHGNPWMACVIVGAGSLRAEGKGVESPQRDQAFYSAAGARLGAQLPVSESLFVRLHGDLAIALTRTTFYLDEKPRWSSSPIHAGAGLAFGGSF